MGSKYKKINGMMGKIKIFDQKLSDTFDTKSRNLIKKILGTDMVDDNPNKYGEDMIVINKLIPYDYIELQVYGKWTNEYFPYNMPFVYERKLKFCARTLFICFNSKYDELIMFCRTSIHPKKYRVKKYSREMMCYVPWSKAVRIYTKDFTTESILNYSGIYLDNETELGTNAVDKIEKCKDQMDLGSGDQREVEEVEEVDEIRSYESD